MALATIAPSSGQMGKAGNMGEKVSDVAGESYSEEEAQRRFEAALRGGLSTPAKPHEEMKLGKSRGRLGKNVDDGKLVAPKPANATQPKK